MAIRFNKSYLHGKTNYGWLENKLDITFDLPIDDSKSKIVFGFNGIGKTSISRCIKEYDSTNIRFLNYEENIKNENGKEIKIVPFINDIERISKNIKDNELSIDFGALSKAVGFKRSKDANDPSFIKNYKKKLTTGTIASSLKCNSAKYKSFLAKYPLVDSKQFFKVLSKLSSLVISKDEIDNYRKTKYEEFLNQAKSFVEDNNKCPVCDTAFEDINIVIDSKIKAIGAKKSELVEQFEKDGVKCNTALIDNYCDLYKELETDVDLLNDFIICGKDGSIHERVTSISGVIAGDKAKLASLNSEKIKKYNELKIKESAFKKDIARYMKIDISNIIFDDTLCEITISLDRETSTYSTGQRHILWFLVEIYSFLGSDSSTLILDDPASSLDLINMYKIAFEIVRNDSSPNKAIVVFTHSTTLVNTINSQKPDFFDAYYIEEYQGKLYCNEINYKRKGIANIFTIERLEVYNRALFDSLKKREDEGSSSSEHSVYHWDTTEKFSTISASLSNHILVRNIDSYSPVIKKDFFEDSYNKILLLISLRVWLEKALFSLIPSSDTARKDAFLDEFSIFNKIKVLENARVYGTNLLSINRIEKEEILSKKVMLNQNLHFYSQVMPFEYAINISLDDLDLEINEIKNIFI